MLPEDEQRAVAKRADEFVTEQTNVSRLEKRADMKLSMHRNYVESLGGR